LGIAEAVGPINNDPASEDRFAQAHAAIEKAQTLAPMLLKVTRHNRRACQTLSRRSKSDLHAAAEQYRDAMRDVVKRFPDDLDAAIFFAEAE